jgi:hypothetical protein
MRKITTVLFTAILLITMNNAFAQEEDLLKQVGDVTSKKEIVKSAFKSSRVINGHSMEFLNPGTMDFRILHRFGDVSQGYKNLFGLDQASMRIGFDFGILQNLMAGFGRSTFKKEADTYVKYAPIRQTTGGKWNSPVTIALVAGMTIDGLPYEDPAAKNYFSSRMAYYFEATIGRKFNEKFTLQVSPTVVHKNLVQLQADKNNIYAMSIGGRYKFSKRMAFTWDYSHIITAMPQTNYSDPLGIGIDIETGGHVFQLHFSNAAGMNERALITETTGTWQKGNIRFGFNLSRVFQIKKTSTKAKW